MSFVQIIDFETTRTEEMDKLFDEWMQTTTGRRTASHDLHTQDRDRPGHYVEIVEFPSYEEAMRNSEMPETQQFAARMRELCSGEPRFMNLDVLRDADLRS
ncbi:hypothetical protein [Streptacidiphilus monticola]|jgi:hypothetical protein|uniref:Antibiotic biosynthesis monooxygenase n=1 Tax=Streptacidiphilus monticola TaxID=2161674 RepID=A0ABW1FZQ6_9ACTN